MFTYGTISRITMALLTPTPTLALRRTYCTRTNGTLWNVTSHELAPRHQRLMQDHKAWTSVVIGGGVVRERWRIVTTHNIVYSVNMFENLVFRVVT